jgi:glutathione synthase/RimK-type ligase-like ATP-grasp enzyme
MILLIGEGGQERMSKAILSALQEREEDVIWLDQNTLPVDNTISIRVVDGKLQGRLYLKDKMEIDLDDINGIYTRLSYLQTDLNLNSAQKDFMQAERAIAIELWLEHTDAMVINRIKSQRTNGSKLLQTWIVEQYGFKVPESLLTNDPEKVKEFYEANKKHGIIYKSASGERSMVTKFTEEDFERLVNLKSCPSLFQKIVPGIDIRIHTLASGEVFPTEIRSESSDYRYDSERMLEPIKIPEKVKETCVNLTRDLGLYISGIDTRRSPDGEFYCFEVNPSPAFYWYEAQTGQPISEAVAELLIKGKDFVKKGLVKRKY